MNIKFKSFLHRLFKWATLIKGVDGILDVVVGSILLFSLPNFISKTFLFIFGKELMEDPQDIIANYLLVITQNILPNTKFFIVIYLIIHGLIKIGIALALQTKNYCVYKAVEIILFIFICYQFYRFNHTHSNILLFFTFIDVIILFLTYSESKELKK